VSFTTMRQLTGNDLGAFRAKLRAMQAVPVGHGVDPDAE